MDEIYKLKYLKYKQKYINLKGGRLIDILDSPGNKLIKTKCDTVENIKKNFALCNKVNDSLATSENSYIIFLWFLNSIKEDEIQTLEKIILFHKVKSNNVFILSHNSFDMLTKHISFDTKEKSPEEIKNHLNFISILKQKNIKVDNEDFIPIFKQKIIDIIGSHESIPEYKSTINITIYNLTHGNFKNFNSDLFLNSDDPKVFITKKQYFECISPIFDSKNFINLSIVNNNCYSTYIFHGYFKNEMTKLAKHNELVNIFTYSTRPYMKYLFYLRFILLFFSKSNIVEYSKKTSDNDKFNHFLTINTYIQNKLDTDSTFASSVETIFYESLSEIKSSLNKFFYFFQPLCNFSHLDQIYKKLNEKSFKDTYAYTGANINSIDLYEDENITNSINQYLEQSSSMSLDSYLKLEINNTELELDFKYNNKFDINKSIKDLNNEIRTDTFVDEVLTKDYMNVGGLNSLNNFLNNDLLNNDLLENNLLKKLIKISFIEQKDILFVPIEPDDVKREIMRNKKLIDLL